MDAEMEDSDAMKRDRFDALVALQKSNAAQAISGFQELLAEETASNADHVSRFQEWAIYHLCDLYAEVGQTAQLVSLLSQVRPLFGRMPKAKGAKVIRHVLTAMARIPDTTEAQIELCEEYIVWAREEKRAFMRQRIQARLANLLLTAGRFQKALKLLTELQNEVKKLDDKQLLVEIFLVESRVYHALLNLPRAKSSLTAARSLSNSIYLGPLLQGEIDMQGGVLNADEKDFRTSYSYFYEAFESFVTLDDPRAEVCLKYMALSKIMNGQGSEVPTILNTKKAVPYTGPEILSMRAIAKAYAERSLNTFGDVLKEYAAQIVNDELVQRHLKDLQADLLEQNLVRIIEPFSRVEIAHVASLIDLDVATIEQKLSQMILDKKFAGILDQGTGELVVFEDQVADTTYQASLDVLTDMSNVTDSLFRRTGALEA